MGDIGGLYQQVLLFDPTNLVADLRFPEIKARLVEIETVQRASFAQCTTREDYIRQLNQLVDIYRTQPTYFDYFRLAQLFRCMLLYSAVNTPNVPLGTVPSLSAKISNLVNDLQRNPSSTQYYTFQLISNGMQLARVKTTNTKSLTTRDNLLINEVWIGMVFLNTLKDVEVDPSPYFKYIYGAYSCGMLDLEGPNMAQACCSGSGVFYSLEENVLGGQVLGDWMDDPERTDIELGLLYVQLIKAFGQAAAHGVAGFGLTSNDILIRNAPITVILSPEQELNVPFYPVIVDFTKCRALAPANGRYTSGYQDTTDIIRLRATIISRLRDRVGTVAEFISAYPNPNARTLQLPVEIFNYLTGQGVAASQMNWQSANTQLAANLAAAYQRR